jgi:hypothetical protein
MGDLFTLYSRLKEKDSLLLDAVRGVVHRILAAEQDRSGVEDEDKREMGAEADSSAGA